MAIEEPERAHFDRADGRHSYLSWTRADAGGHRPRLHFAHANGFNALTYRRILCPLADRVDILASDLRGHGSSSLPADPDRHVSWIIYRDDLIAFLDHHRQTRGDATARYVLAGHSMGATTSLLVALHRPDLVQALVLFDPVVLARTFFWEVSWRRRFGLAQPMPPIAKGALSRRAVFPDQESVLNAYRGRGAFKTWPEEILADYVMGGTRPLDDGTVTLSCAPAWEAANFSRHDHNFWPRLSRLACPVVLLRGETGSTCPEPHARALMGKIPQGTDEVVPGTTHFVPMERPDLVVDTLARVMAV